MCSPGIFPLPGCVHPALTGPTWRTAFVPWLWVGGRKIFHFPHFPSMVSPCQAGRGHSQAVTIWGHSLLLFSPFIISPSPCPNPRALLTFVLPVVLGWEGRERRAALVPRRSGRSQAQLEPCPGLFQQGERNCESLAQVSPQGVQLAQNSHGFCVPFVPELPEDCRGRWESFVEETLTETNRRNTVDLVSWSLHACWASPDRRKGYSWLSSFAFFC